MPDTTSRLISIIDRIARRTSSSHLCPGTAMDVPRAPAADVSLFDEIVGCEYKCSEVVVVACIDEYLERAAGKAKYALMPHRTIDFVHLTHGFAGPVRVARGSR